MVSDVNPTDCFASSMSPRSTVKWPPVAADIFI